MARTSWKWILLLLVIVAIVLAMLLAGWTWDDAAQSALGFFDGN